MDKGTAHIESWVKYGEGKYSYLIGVVSKHPRQDEFSTKYQQTSNLVSFDPANGVAETANTVYTLGKPASMEGVCLG